MITLAGSLLLLVAGTASEGEKLSSSDDIESQIAAARTARNTCGPVSVWFCSRRLGREVDLKTVLERAEIEEEGIRLDRLLDLAKSLGLPARAVVFDPKRLDAVPKPAILVIGQSHCVVLGAVDDEKGQARIFEPATGEVGGESVKLLTKHWSGEAIVFADPPMPLSGLSWLFTLAATCTVVGIVFASLALGRRGGWVGRRRASPSGDHDSAATGKASSDRG